MVNEALGTLAPRLVGQLRVGALLPSIWFVVVLVVMWNSTQSSSQGEGRFEEVNAWFSVDASDLVFPALMSLFVAFVFDLSFPILARFLMGAPRWIFPVRNPIRDFEDAAAGFGRHANDGWRRQRVLARRNQIPSRCSTAQSAGLEYCWSRWGTAVLAMFQGPNRFDHSRCGHLLMAKARADRPTDDPLSGAFDRSVALLGVALGSTVAAALTPLIMGEAFGRGEIGLVILGLLAIGRATYLASSNAIGAAGKAMDDLYYQYRWSVLEEIEPAPRKGKEWKAPKKTDAEVKRWDRALRARDTQPVLNA